MSSGTTAPATCIVCGGSDFAPPSYCEGLFRCDACGLVMRPIPEQERLDEAFYQEQHFESIDPDWIEGRQRVFADELRRLQAFRRSGRILDVGAGHGFFLSACQQGGWQTLGLEIGRHPAAYARQQFDLEILETPIETAGLPDGAFDAVTFWNVLDQVPDPRTALNAAVRALRPGGVLLVRCPNADFHLPIRQLARRCAAIAPPHTQPGPPDGLPSLLVSAVSPASIADRRRPCVRGDRTGAAVLDAGR